MKRMVLILTLALCLTGSANAVLTVSVNGEDTMPGREISLNRGDEVVIEVWGDGSTTAPLNGFFFVEGPGSIDGYSIIYTGVGSEYYDLEELAQAAGQTTEQTLAEYSTSTGKNLTDLSKWMLVDYEYPVDMLKGTLMAGIVFRCEDEGDARLTLETDDEWTTYPNYTIVFHQTAVTNTYHVDANTGDDNNTGLSPDQPFATIQKAVDSAYEGETIIVHPGRYLGDINFPGKNIILRSTDPNDSAIVEQTIIGGDFRLEEPEAVITFSGNEGPNCKLWGFSINGSIQGSDPLFNNHTHATISHCLLCNNLGDCGTVIRNFDGLIRNCVLAGSNVDYCNDFDAAAESCHGTIRNCTFANNATQFAVRVGSGGITRIENCILHDSAVFIEFESSLEISYTNLRGYAFETDPVTIVSCDAADPECALQCDGLALGPGIISTNPCFVSIGDGSMGILGDYHLKSQVGRWHADSNVWTYDTATSLCIDAGNPGSPLGDELWSWLNKRINMGAYGGTAEASKTPVNWSRLADLTNDGIVDARDFAFLTKNRYSPQKEKPGDLNRNGTVRMDDLAILLGEWLSTTVWH